MVTAVPRRLSRAVVPRGRDAELAAVAKAVEHLDQGRGHALMIEGPPGIGKTALLAEAADLGERAGARVLIGEAVESPQTVPFASLLAALSSGEPPAVDPAAVRRLEGATDAQYWVMHDLRSSLQTAAARSPLVIALDDLQWADSGTLAALASLVPALSALPVLWLLAARSARRPRAVSEMLARLPREHATHLRLTALAPDAVDALVRDLTGGEADPTLAALADRAHGNPLLLVELLRGLGEEERLHVVQGRRAVSGDSLPRRLTVSISDRLAALSADAEQVVRVAAVLPPRFSAAQLAAVLRLPPSSLMAPLKETLEADLLAEAGEHLRFRHDLLRQAVLETIPRSLRRALLRDAVGMLLATGTGPAEVALQLAETAEPGDRAAVRALRDAAASIARWDASTAAHLSARALDLLPRVDADRALVTAETVTLLHRARRSDEAEALADRALAGVLPPQAEAEVRLSLSSMMMRPTVARTEENRRALALPGLTPLIHGRHLAWLAYNLGAGGEVVRAEAAAVSALEIAEITEDVETRVMAGIALAAVEAAAGAFTQALARIEDLRRSSQAERGLFTAALALHYAHTLAVLGRLDEARAVVVDGVVSAREERDSLLLTAWTQFGGLLSMAAGQLSDARAEVASSLQGEAETGADAFAGVVRMVALSHLGAHLGDGGLLRGGRAAAQRVGRDSSPAVRRLAVRLLARTASGQGSGTEAVRLLADDPLMPAATPLVPNDIGYHPWVAHIARVSGADDLAERAAGVAEFLDRQNPDVPLLAGLASHTRGVVTNDAALLVDAARLLEGTQRPLLAAAAAEDAGRVLTEGGRRAEGLEHLDTALDTYAAHGATADAHRVGRLLRRHGGTRRPRAGRPDNGLASLTGSELQVVRLVATGATNRSAAEQLHLSPHTVSSHLRSAFAKLGINSRVQLARVVQEIEA